MQNKKVEFAFATWQSVARARNVPPRNFVAVARPIPKRAAKHDKKAAAYARTHDIKPALAPERAYEAAGLRKYRWQFVPR